MIALGETPSLVLGSNCFLLRSSLDYVSSASNCFISFDLDSMHSLNLSCRSRTKSSTGIALLTHLEPDLGQRFQTLHDWPRHELTLEMLLHRLISQLNLISFIVYFTPSH